MLENFKVSRRQSLNKRLLAPPKAFNHFPQLAGSDWFYLYPDKIQEFGRNPSIYIRKI